MRNRSVLTVLTSLVLVACTSVSSGQGPAITAAPEPIDVTPWSGELPISAPWLRERLPAQALTYERIPHPLAMMSIPKGNTFDTALRSDANIRNLISIQQGLVDNLGISLPPVRLLEHLRSPIEVFAVAAPAPAAMIGATLSFRSNQQFESFIAELGQFAPISLNAPLDAQGFGLLAGLPIPISINFDAASGRLALYVAPFPDQASFASMLNAEAPTAPHPMHAFEEQIDASGQGLFAWVNAGQALQTAAMFSPEIAQTLTATGASQIRGIALGAGVADGKGRLKILADVGVGNVNRPLPVVNNALTATSVGEPRSLFLMSIPSVEEFARLEAMILANAPPEAGQGWPMAKSMMQQATGTSIEDILSAIGPELFVVSDKAGGYLGLHVRDQALVDSVLDTWASIGGATIEARNIGGQTIRSVDLPGMIGMPQAAMAEGEAAAIFALLSRMRNRIYWIEDGDYLYLASTPQLLIDRIELGADTSIASWLNDTQRVDLSSSLLAATGSARNLPHVLYNGYIGVMQSLADLAGVEYDVWAMPTANQLRLPESGTLGASVNLGEPWVSLELSYESHPAELLFGSGGAAIAAAGIAAAIALPAYQDYTVRAQVSEGLALANGPKMAVEQSWQSTGAAPADLADAAVGLPDDLTEVQGRYVQSIDVVDGEVIIHYGNAAHRELSGDVLVLTPYMSSDSEVAWSCGYGSLPGSPKLLGADAAETTIERKYLPSACR